MRACAGSISAGNVSWAARPRMALNFNHLYAFHVAAVEGSVASAAQRLGSGSPWSASSCDALDGRVTSTDFMLPLLALDGSVPSLRAGDGSDLVRELRGNELDLVLIESELPAAARQGLELVDLERVTLFAVAQPMLSPAPDWHDVGIVQCRTSAALRWDIETFLHENGLRPKVVGEADDALFLLEAAARGGYVAFIPRSVARSAIATKRLKLLAQVEAAHAGVYALYQDGDTADLARRAVHVLLEQVRAVRELDSIS